jgi:hypothetical protein
LAGRVVAEHSAPSYWGGRLVAEQAEGGRLTSLLLRLLLGVPKQTVSSRIAKQSGAGLLGLSVAKYCVVRW